MAERTNDPGMSVKEPRAVTPFSESTKWMRTSENIEDRRHVPKLWDRRGTKGFTTPDEGITDSEVGMGMTNDPKERLPEPGS
jgi:hypothetical protein